MHIKFKSFRDKCVTKHQYSALRGNYQSTTATPAVAQVEKFIMENAIAYTDIKNIKFSVDSMGTEHILLVYEED